MTSLTLVTVAVIIYGVLGRDGFGRALALGGATAAGAAVVVGSVAVPTFYAVAMGTVVALGLRLLRPHDGPRDPLPPGAPLLLLFLAWSTLVTVVAPILFDGAATATPDGAGELHAGIITSSNVAQIVYLLLGVCVVVFVARSPHARPELIGLAAGLTTLLSMWRYLSQQVGLPFPVGFFDNSPFYAYIDKAPGDVERFRGILSEPSALAASCLITIAYMLSRSVRVRGWRRTGTFTVAAIAAYLGAISTSATFVVASVVVGLVALLTLGLGFLLRRVSVSVTAGVVGCAAMVVALWLLPVAADFVQATVDDKVSSSSFSERSGANETAYELFFRTFGMGSGLGANRASSFFPGLLSTTGLIGTLLLAGAVALLVRRSLPDPAYRPVMWALVSSIVLKVVAGPDLSDSSGVFWIALGLLSKAVMGIEARRRAARASGAEADVGLRA